MHNSLLTRMDLLLPENKGYTYSSLTKYVRGEYTFLRHVLSRPKATQETITTLLLKMREVLNAEMELSAARCWAGVADIGMVRCLREGLGVCSAVSEAVHHCGNNNGQIE